MQYGRYETLRPIASGGMATVHLGRVLGAGGFERLVAIKVLHPHIVSEPDFVSMFLDEARLAARVRHPNVVATIDVQEEPLFLVMDYVEGPTLQTLLREFRRRQEAIPIEVALRIFVDVLAGLHAAHELTGADGELLQLVHRDVSPHNVLLGADGITRIMDFGVARATSRLSSTRGNQVKGKLAYMAPEQIRADNIDRRVDVYAAGAVLWEMLSNRPLFRADNDAALVSQIVHGAPRSPRQVVPTVPPRIDAVCMRALALSASKRFPTAADFADALEAAAQADGVPIATGRAVAKLVKDVKLHEAPPSASSSSSSRKAPAVAPPPAKLDTPAPPMTEKDSTSVATIFATHDEPVKRRRWPWVMAVLLAFGGIGAGLALTKPWKSTDLAAPPTTPTPAATTSASSEASATEALAAEASGTEATAAAPASASFQPAPPLAASAEASAPSASASAPGRTTGPHPRPTGATKPPTSLTSFRPEGL